MQNALLCAILAVGIAMLFTSLDSETYSKVYVAENGHEFVIDHDLSYLDCKTSTMMTDPSFRCVRD